MYIYKMWQDVNNDWDTYDSAVVVADNIQDAKVMHPDNDLIWKNGLWVSKDTGNDYGTGTWTWCDIDDVNIEILGIADDKYNMPCVVVASFNAG